MEFQWLALSLFVVFFFLSSIFSSLSSSWKRPHNYQPSKGFVVQLYPWLKFSSPLILIMIMKVILYLLKNISLIWRHFIIMFNVYNKYLSIELIYSILGIELKVYTFKICQGSKNFWYISRDKFCFQQVLVKIHKWTNQNKSHAHLQLLPYCSST